MPFPAQNRPLKVAIVHDWLTGMRGGEKVLQLICRLVPQADVFTLIHTPGVCGAAIESRRIRTSLLNALPGVQRYYRNLLPLMPAAIEAMDVGKYDLVISSSHCVAKGIGGRRPDQLHLCYCYTPMRYIWDVADDYEQRMGLSGLAMRALGPLLRAWDRRSAGRVDRFIAISRCVAERIQRCYGRDSDVVYPPVDVDYYSPDPRVPREDFYLVVSALAPYKKVDHAVEAFRQLRRPLKVIGTGQMAEQIARDCPPNVELLGWQSDTAVRDHLRRCRALLFPGLEDFGIVPLEATACGTPVIAHAAGGALETVRDAAGPGATGLLYDPQTPEALAEAVRRFENLAIRWDAPAMHAWAARFSNRRFLEGFTAAADRQLSLRSMPRPWATNL